MIRSSYAVSIEGFEAFRRSVVARCCVVVDAMEPLCEASDDMKNGIFADVQSKFSNEGLGSGLTIGHELSFNRLMRAARERNLKAWLSSRHGGGPNVRPASSLR
jgi:hypothetical protein